MYSGQTEFTQSTEINEKIAIIDSKTQEKLAKRTYLLAQLLVLQGDDQEQIQQDITTLDHQIGQIMEALTPESVTTLSTDEADSKAVLQEWLQNLTTERTSLMAQVLPILSTNGDLNTKESLPLAREPSVERTPLAPLKSDQRSLVIRELVTTEEEFLRDLSLCKDGYLSSSGLLVDSDINIGKLFCNFEEVMAVAATFLESLKVIR